MRSFSIKLLRGLFYWVFIISIISTDCVLMWSDDPLKMISLFLAKQFKKEHPVLCKNMVKSLENQHKDGNSEYKNIAAG